MRKEAFGPLGGPGSEIYGPGGGGQRVKEETLKALSSPCTMDFNGHKVDKFSFFLPFSLFFFTLQPSLSALSLPT